MPDQLSKIDTLTSTIAFAKWMKIIYIIIKSSNFLGKIFCGTFFKYTIFNF